VITAAVGAEDLRLRFVLFQGKKNHEFLAAVLADIFKARHIHLPGLFLVLSRFNHRVHREPLEVKEKMPLLASLPLCDLFRSPLGSSFDQM
jgi:hypothetical protein